MTNTYTAITIGPIIETLNAARKTRELWGASYLFSYTIRKIVEKLKHDTIEVLLPYYEEKQEWKNSKGAGLFPDRIFVEGKIDIETLYYQPVIKDISESIAKWFIENKNISRKLQADEMYSYLYTYFRFIQVHFDCTEKENIIEKGTTLLDSRELNTKIIPENIFIEEENPLFYFLYNVNGSFLFEDGFEKTRKRFPSLIEIASKNLEVIDKDKYQQITKKIEEVHEKFDSLNSEKQNEKDEDDIVELFQNIYGNQFLQIYKYIAIVQADGDKIGQMVAKVGTNKTAVQNFSQKLMEYSRTATDIVVKYGGSPVYMGGDDLFFFAPLVYNVENKKTHIFEMTAELNDSFNNIVTKYAKETLQIKETELPSLSFGISLSYHKFPLYEAKKMAFSALFEDIKWADKRNAIKVKFRKHSGQTIELFVNKRVPKLWEETIKFINASLNINADFLNSFTHKLRLQEDVLFDKIACDKEKLEFFFKNNNNENYKLNKNYFESLSTFIHEIHNNKEKKDYLYPVLRFIHFLKS